MNKLREYLEEHGLQIGSRKWGGFTEHSDYDYVIPSTHKARLSEICSELFAHIEVLGDDYDTSELNHQENLMVSIRDEIRINIMLYADFMIPVMEKLDGAMMALKPTSIGKDIAKSKFTRVFYFRSFLSTLLTGVPLIDIQDQLNIMFGHPEAKDTHIDELSKNADNMEDDGSDIPF